MRAAFFGLVLVSLGACATRPPLDTPAAPSAVAVTRNDDSWTADFHFPRRARAWAFIRSSPARAPQRSWRTQSWTVETPGVRLERRGHYDLLAATGGGRVPEHVRIRFRPFSAGLISSYTPALVFGDGSVALFSEQFDAFPLRSARQAERLPVDLSGNPIGDSRTRVTFSDVGGPVLWQGERRPSVTVDDDEGSYILFGPAEPAAGEAMATIIDPQLPAWIRDTLLRDTPVLLDRYAAALGPRPGPRPTLMVTWAGPTPHVFSMDGSVLPGMILMTYEGEGVLTESETRRRQGLWFIAHESAHFWLGQAVTYQYSRDAWITEGGADLLAARTVPQIDPGYDARGLLQSAVDDCITLTRGRGVASAEQRNEHRAYYACGAVFGLIAEAASHRPFAEFVRQLVDANRADRILTREEWLAALDQASGDTELSAGIARLIDVGSDDPRAAVLALFARAGVAFTPAPDGSPRLQ